MAGEIQLNSTTLATESSGSITAEVDTIRPNTPNGSLTLQGDSSDAGVTGLTIDSSGNATFAQTISGGTLGSSVVFPAGHILQVVEGFTDTAVTVSTTDFTDTGLTKSITPISSSSKILVIASQQATSNRTATTGEINIDIQLLRGATVLEEYADFALYANATGLATIGGHLSVTYLDSPNTTSATTYKMQGKPDSTANSQVAIFQAGDRGRSSIVLMEIAG